MRNLLRVAVVGVVGLAALFVYAVFIEPRMLKVRNVTLGQGDAELRMALVADFQIGSPHVNAARMKDIIARINALNPDVVLVPGDFVDGRRAQDKLSARKRRNISAGLSELSDLKGLKIATMGNHDNWYGRHNVEESLYAAGFIILENEAYQSAAFCYVGLSDAWTGEPSARAFDACEGSQKYVVLMHSPDSRHLLPDDTLLAVAGHTHGGQVNLPIFGRVNTATDCGKACAYGWIQSAPPLFVTSGIGTSILPLRFRSPPEIVILTLKYTADEESQYDPK